jgi:hypothetical protein
MGNTKVLGTQSCTGFKGFAQILDWIQKVDLRRTTLPTQREERGGKAVGSSPREKADPKLEEITGTLPSTITTGEVGGAESQRVHQRRVE